MKMIIHIKNTLNTKQDIVLLDAMFTDGLFSKKGIIGTVDIIDSEKKENNRTITYSELVKQLLHVPYEISIQGTSNNRQIYFYSRTVRTLKYGDRYNNKPYKPLEPHLTKDGKSRKSRWSVKYQCDMYSPEWDEKEWNIADTHQHFILDNKIVFELQLNPKQKFSINIDVMPKFDFNKLNRASMPVIFTKTIDNAHEKRD
jgi:hypothetical protein